MSYRPVAYVFTDELLSLAFYAIYVENCPEEIWGQRIISWKNIISQQRKKRNLYKPKNCSH
jgi:hypothetical protein